MNNCALRPSTKPMKRSPMARGTKPMRTRRKYRPKNQYLEACRGESCYLLMPGVVCSGRDTVVPAHGNEARYGKGMGIKAGHEFTVPGCAACHAELDQGRRFTKDEKRTIFADRLARWAVVRDARVSG